MCVADRLEKCVKSDRKKIELKENTNQYQSHALIGKALSLRSHSAEREASNFENTKKTTKYPKTKCLRFCYLKPTHDKN